MLRRVSGFSAPSHPSLSEWLLLRCVAEIFSTLNGQLVPDVLAGTLAIPTAYMRPTGEALALREARFLW
ncbi:hypothetical protein NKW84_10545 [Acetobacter senegalensis]|uniref:hypothetical protein n=1 Tax=Acetobacter senegalensis TaxID=446692 RepID=UPI0020A20D2A|nr:hypothetical protein [Acetobacter senegalensis]MCP1196297.1 hypothetical protein [Acetobacter senegalensis]